MRLRHYIFFAMMMILTLFILGGCTEPSLYGKKVYGAEKANFKQGATALNDKIDGADPYAKNERQVQDRTAVKIPITDINGKPYVSLNKLTETLQFQSEWDNNKQAYIIGDAAPVMEISVNSPQSLKEDIPIYVMDVPIVNQQKMFLPVSSLSDLFHDEMSFFVQGKELIILAFEMPRSVESMESNAVAKEQLDFAEDPNDPFRGVDGNIRKSKVGRKKADVPHLLANAQRYEGVEYKFAAGPFPQTGFFDNACFTQYVFGKSGLTLPRTVRAQAKWGTTVSRKKLRKGDLLFFNIPGVYKSSMSAGIVGIYKGDMKMVAALPKLNDMSESGVQVVNIDRPFWKSTFLHAKRAAF